MTDKFFINGSKPHRVDFPDGQWVDIKPEMTQEDQDYIMSELVAVEGREAITMRAGFLPLLNMAIVAWSFEDDAGKAIPVTKDNISNLKIKYRQKVVEEADRIYTEALTFLPPKSGKV